MKQPTLILALAGVLVGGSALAAWQTFRSDYAEVVSVQPVTVEEDIVAQVLSARPITELVASPREICSDVAVARRLPERDGNVGGAVAGAVIGGLIGNQVGGGDGRKLATVAGAVAGGYAGREVDRRHVGGRVVQGTERRCETVNEAQQRTVAWDVDYRTKDGQEGRLRAERDPGATLVIGRAPRVIGYDVTYRYDSVERTVRMDEDPGSRLPVVDGSVVLATDASARSTR